ncbi:MAG: hypothetical protein J7549_19910 [Variovorax sp.]|nr:hypothetical protein [Variovorax sp.]
MRDEMDVRMGNARQVEFSRGRLMDAFRQLVAIQYDAPWRATPSRCRV